MLNVISLRDEINGQEIERRGWGRGGGVEIEQRAPG